MICVSTARPTPFPPSTTSREGHLEPENPRIVSPYSYKLQCYVVDIINQFSPGFGGGRIQGVTRWVIGGFVVARLGVAE